jgi:MscS family membrane protein
MMRKKIKTIRYIIYYCPITLIICLICYSYFSSTGYNNRQGHRKTIQTDEEKYSLSSFLWSGEQLKQEIFNQKTPRALFAKLINETLLVGCGYYGDSLQAISCIAHDRFNTVDENDLKNGIDKCIMLLCSISSISFQYSQIPLSVPGNTLELVLGDGGEKITYYLEKEKNGNWIFSEKNFKNPKILNIYSNYIKKTKNPEFLPLRSMTPIRAYLNFIFGCIGKYDFTFHNALNVINLQKLPGIVKNKYSKFIAFVLFKVLTTKKIGFTLITGESSVSNVEILYIKPGVGTIYLKKIYQKKTGTYKWVFPKRALMAALKIYNDDLMITTPYDPLFFKVQHWLFVNLSFLQYRLFGIAYQALLMLFLGIYLSVFVYRFTRKLIKLILGFLIRTIITYPIHTARFCTFSALIIAVFVAVYLVESSLIFYLNLYIFFTYAVTVLYTVLFIGWLCEVVNIACTIIKFLMEKKGSRGFGIGFIVEIIRRICDIIIVIVFVGILLDKLGVNMLNFITALGIGGLAVALAGKDTIENLFGSIMIAFEKPFKLGDWIIIGGDFEGVVEHVGLRSTRIRTFEDSYMTVPNVKFITSSVDNMGERTYRRYTTTLDLEDSTPPGLIKSFTAGITELIRKTPSMRKREYHIRVNDVGESSIKILVYVFFVTQDWASELRERERFILNILRLAEGLGIKFAYPTQTLMLSKMKKSDDKNSVDMDLEQLRKSTFKAKKTAGKIIDSFKRKPPK